MIKVVILGGGNLAFHITTKLLMEPSIKLVQVYNRTIEKLEYLKPSTSITNQVSEIMEADLYILAVSDNVISEISSQLNVPNKLVVHTSGSISMDALQSNSNKGVLYFLQSFSKDINIDFSTIPIAMEAENEKDYKLLEKLASIFSNKLYHLNSNQRKTLHVAAVFANNFTNHLFYQASEICTHNNIPFEMLHPLIQETAHKITETTPFLAQTGPAKRNDTKTIEKHLAMLSNQQQEIYALLTKYIQTTYGEKL